jgi:hypothetical protein
MTTTRRLFRTASRLVATATVAAAVALAAPASASVMFDPSTGTGSIDKRLIQEAFGWNNATLQDRASGVTFRYEQAVIAYVDCTKEVQKRTMSKSWIFEQSVTDELIVESKATKGGRQQVVGFNLSGFAGSPRAFGDAPACPGGWEQEGEIYFSAPELDEVRDSGANVSESPSLGLLVAVSNDVQVAISAQ